MFGWFKSKRPAFPSSSRVYGPRSAKLEAIRRACTGSALPTLVVCPFEDTLGDLLPSLPAAARIENREALSSFTSGARLGLVKGEVLVSEVTMSTVRIKHPLTILVAERHPLRRLDDVVLTWAAECPPETTVTYFCSLEDGIFSRFEGPRMLEFMRRLGMRDDEPIENPWVEKAFAKAQRKLEKRARSAAAARSCTEWLALNVG